MLQGNYQHGVGDYKRILDDLERLLQGTTSRWNKRAVYLVANTFGIPEDARGWGYKWSAQERKYVADQTAPRPPFVLHLVHRGQITIPTELQNVIIKHTDLVRISLRRIPLQIMFWS